MQYQLFTPRHWGSWCALGVLRLIACLPYAGMLVAGRVIGKVARSLPLGWVRTARRNIELCLPELSSEAREQLLDEHFASLGMGVCESAMSWWSTDEQIRALSKVEKPADPS